MMGVTRVGDQAIRYGWRCRAKVVAERGCISCVQRGGVMCVAEVHAMTRGCARRGAGVVLVCEHAWPRPGASATQGVYV
jgi:hypothetical protein